MSHVPAWDVLAGLPAWRAAGLPRREPRGGNKNGDAAGLAAGEPGYAAAAAETGAAR